MDDLRDSIQTISSQNRKLHQKIDQFEDNLIPKQSDPPSKLDQGHLEAISDVKTERLSNNAIAIREEGCPDEIDAFSVEAGFHDLHEKMESIRDAIARQQHASDEHDKSILPDIKAVFNELKVNQRKILENERLPSMEHNIIDIKQNMIRKDSFIDVLG